MKKGRWFCFLAQSALLLRSAHLIGSNTIESTGETGDKKEAVSIGICNEMMFLADRLKGSGPLIEVKEGLSLARSILQRCPGFGWEIEYELKKMESVCIYYECTLKEINNGKILIKNLLQKKSEIVKYLNSHCKLIEGGLNKGDGKRKPFMMNIVKKEEWMKELVCALFLCKELKYEEYYISILRNCLVNNDVYRNASARNIINWCRDSIIRVVRNRAILITRIPCSDENMKKSVEDEIGYLFRQSELAVALYDTYQKKSEKIKEYFPVGFDRVIGHYAELLIQSDIYAKKDVFLSVNRFMCMHMHGKDESVVDMCVYTKCIRELEGFWVDGLKNDLLETVASDKRNSKESKALWSVLCDRLDKVQDPSLFVHKIERYLDVTIKMISTAMGKNETYTKHESEEFDPLHFALCRKEKKLCLYVPITIDDALCFIYGTDSTDTDVKEKSTSTKKPPVPSYRIDYLYPISKKPLHQKHLNFPSRKEYLMKGFDTKSLESMLYIHNLMLMNMFTVKVSVVFKELHTLAKDKQTITKIKECVEKSIHSLSSSLMAILYKNVVEGVISHRKKELYKNTLEEKKTRSETCAEREHLSKKDCIDSLSMLTDTQNKIHHLCKSILTRNHFQKYCRYTRNDYSNYYIAMHDLLNSIENIAHKNIHAVSLRKYLSESIKRINEEDLLIKRLSELKVLPNSFDGLQAILKSISLTDFLKEIEIFYSIDLKFTGHCRNCISTGEIRDKPTENIFKYEKNSLYELEYISSRKKNCPSILSFKRSIEYLLDTCTQNKINYPLYSFTQTDETTANKENTKTSDKNTDNPPNIPQDTELKGSNTNLDTIYNKQKFIVLAGNIRSFLDDLILVAITVICMSIYIICLLYSIDGIKYIHIIQKAMERINSLQKRSSMAYNKSYCIQNTHE